MEYRSEPNRIFCTDAAGKCVAEITFPETTPGVCCIDHTFVDDSLRGMGIAGELVSRAVAPDPGRRKTGDSDVFLCGTLAGKA